jgi:hypothetical protein
MINFGVKGAFLVGRLCWELVRLPFDLAGAVMGSPRPQGKPARVTIYTDPLTSKEESTQSLPV